MIIPIKCYTCGNVLGSKYNKYKKYSKSKKLYLEKNKIYLPSEIDLNDKMEIITKNEKIKRLDNFIHTNNKQKTIESLILDNLGLHRYCCRRILISHVDIL